jgi:hypothetical protein
MKGLFDPVITEITSLIERQVNTVKDEKNALIDVYICYHQEQQFWNQC